MTFIFYDTETTGLEPAFDQIVQFAAIVTDDQFNVQEELNLRCRLRPHVIASPGAMRVTRVGPKTIQSAPLSCYEMALQVRKFIERHSPAIFVGFNSIKFDENMLRQMFFQALHPTYLTNTNGNSRVDILRLAHAVASHKPEAINVPINDQGKPSFKLSHLIAANELSLDNTHDAMADAKATLDLARLLRGRAPQVWDDLFACRSRHTVELLLKERPIFLYTDRALKNPTILAGTITSHPNNPAAVAVFDLAYDPGIYLGADQEGLQRLLKFSDARYREFAERIIYAEAPDGLPQERHTALKSWHRERHITKDGVPWLTIKKAQDELVAIKAEMVADETALMAEIEEYLGELAASIAVSKD